jgi:decaprenyl-phosphate phosphoribosyltransferase
MKTLVLFIRSTRPSQWPKNLFVVAPVIFAKQHTAQDPYIFFSSFLGFLIFVLVSGFVYVFNDIRDREWDRIHPQKSQRPIASGALSPRMGLFLACIALLVATALSLLLPLGFLACVFCYVLTNLAYSLFLRRIAYLDVIVIAFGFLLRILAGCFAIDLAPSEISYFLILCTFLLSLYLGLGKRKHEMLVLGATRESLKKYNNHHINLAMWATGVTTALAYAFYTVAPRTLQYFNMQFPRLVVSIPFVILGLLRFQMLATRSASMQSPTEVMVKDTLFLANILVWGVSVLWAIYL